MSLTHKAKRLKSRALRYVYHKVARWYSADSHEQARLLRDEEMRWDVRVIQEDCEQANLRDILIRNTPGTV